jgi:hypothetical protein
MAKKAKEGNIICSYLRKKDSEEIVIFVPLKKLPKFRRVLVNFFDTKKELKPKNKIRNRK